MTLVVRQLSARPLVYTDRADADEDRPAHVRAGSAIAARKDELFVVQDDVSFIARVRGDEVTSIALPRGPGGRRRFEIALGNKLDKLDLESCVIDGDELVAFGSGSLPNRERVVRVALASGDVIVEDRHELYARIRDAIGGAINIEGVARVRDELWFCHRGNTSARDRPAIVRVRDEGVVGVDRFELDGLGFTDACAIGDRVVVLLAAEASANAIDDGAVTECALAVIEDGRIVDRAPLLLDDRLQKAEGIAMRGRDRAWITVDPDDPDHPTTLYDIEIKS